MSPEMLVRAVQLFNLLFCFFFVPNSTVHYCLTNNKHFTFPANSLPEQLHSQKEIVELMANYMEQNLMEVWEKFMHWVLK